MKMKKRVGRLAKKYIPYGVIERIHFPEERKLYFNRDISVEGKRPSVAFFTLQKCASTFTPKLMKLLSDKYLDLTCVDLEGYLYNKTEESFNGELVNRPWILQQTGYVYCPLRYALDLKYLSNITILLMLRDPRDIMVSQYYSSAYSHEVPVEPNLRKKFLENREEIQSMDVDEYVLSRVERMKHRFQAYREMVKESNASIHKYEDMVTDFNRFISGVESSLNVVIEDVDRKHLYDMGGFSTAATGDIYQHRRNILPGEHREKLSEQTIARINRELCDVLDFFGYQK
jgi:hypothetical protein